LNFPHGAARAERPAVSLGAAALLTRRCATSADTSTAISPCFVDTHKHWLKAKTKEPS
jgi:hypothetical protein